MIQNFKGAPSKPKVEKVMLSEDGDLHVKWSVEDDGGLEAFKGGIELVNAKTDGLATDDDSSSMTQSILHNIRIKIAYFQVVYYLYFCEFVCRKISI